jgi:hypothetical protein
MFERDVLVAIGLEGISKISNDGKFAENARLGALKNL